MAEHALEAGRLLIEAKDNLKHGEFGPWLRAHVGMSERSARRYMSLARSGVKTATLADLGISAALNYASAVDAIPVPVAGQVVCATDHNGNMLFLWPYADDANYIYKVWISNVSNGTAVGASQKPIHRDWLHRILMNSDFDGFSLANAKFEVIDNASDNLLKFLNDERRQTAPTWHEQECAGAS